jgi:hypothetical protein
MAELFKVFKRLNFFRGFLTTEDDWNEGERYHVQKRALHNLALHAPGVVPQLLGGLRVSQRGRGDMNVEIAAGYAIDGSGRDLYLPEPAIKTINPADYKLPGTVYLVLSFTEEPTDFVAYKENIQFKGHKRITEGVKLDVRPQEPDIAQEVELCRIHLDKGVKAIKDAIDPNSPRPNEIDLRFVPYAGVAGSALKPQLRQDIYELIATQETLFAHFAHELKIPAAADALHSLISLEMLMKAGQVDYRNVLPLLQTVIGLQRGMIDEVERTDPELSKTPEFGTFKWNVESVKLDRRFTPDLLLDIMTTQKNATKAISEKFAQALRPRTKVKAEPEVPSEVVWEKLKIRSEEYTEMISVEGRDFKRIDVIDVSDEASLKKHHFAIAEERDRYRSRQKQKYPDGTVVEDVGVHFEGGHASFEVFNAEPNRDVIVIYRMDYVRGDWECDVHVNGKKGPSMIVLGQDLKFRWRNWPYVVPADLVNEPVLRITMTPVKQDRDVNFFKVWVYQAA